MVEGLLAGSNGVFGHNLERMRVGRHGFQNDVERGVAFEELEPPRELSPGLVAWGVGIRDDTMFAEARGLGGTRT